MPYATMPYAMHPFKPLHVPAAPQALAAALQHYGRRRVLAVVTTTSCFAPRAPDDVVGVARLCAGAGVPHVVNNAYGVQARDTCRLLTSAWNKGRVDAVVQVRRAGRGRGGGGAVGCKGMGGAKGAQMVVGRRGEWTSVRCGIMVKAPRVTCASAGRMCRIPLDVHC